LTTNQVVGGSNPSGRANFRLQPLSLRSKRVDLGWGLRDFSPMKNTLSRLVFVGSVVTCSVITGAAVMTGTAPPEFQEYQALTVDKIRIENTSGKITVSPMIVDKVEISATKRKFSDRCSYRTEKTEYNEIHVKVERPIGEDCEVDLDIKVPKEANLNIWSGSGPVNITGMEGNLTFNLGSGSVTANGKFKKVEGKSGSGSVDIAGLTTGGSISVGSGPVNLRFLDYPTGRMDVKTGNGDTNISFPKGSKVNASLNTGSGDVVNELGTYESADFGITVKTGSGDLKIKAY
jgi:DUF4097 and DUF4098 domain-containing protein YvlB